MIRVMSCSRAVQFRQKEGEREARGVDIIDIL